MTCILLILLLLFQLPSHHNTDSALMESGKAATVKTAAPARPPEFKIVSFNIRWRSGDELKQLIELLRQDQEIGGAQVLALQEVDRRKKRTGNSNVAKLMADDLGMYYAWAAPPTAKPDDEEETGVAILSAYPLSDARRIVLPNEGPNKRRRVALGATLAVHDQKWRVYSVHAETRIDFDKKLEQFKAILQDLSQYPPNMPAIIMGDFNTWEANADRKTIKLFTEAGMQTPFGAQSTFKRRILIMPIKFRLDWVWLRGLEAASYGIDRKVDVSDHWPLWTNVRPSPAGVKVSPANH
jgi:endonuclease/exonuclease/phosphatase family metal-dependent hydrolase